MDNEQWVLRFKDFTISWILMINKVTERILPYCIAPCFYVLKRVEPMWTLKFLFDRKFLMKFGCLLLNYRFCKSLSIPYLYVMWFLFSILKNIAMKCSFLMLTSFRAVSNRTKKSIVLLFFLKPYWNFMVWFGLVGFMGYQPL